MRAVALAVTCAACATTASVCPVGTKRVDVAAAQGRAQWCTNAPATPLAAVPGQGRTYESAFGTAPPPLGAGVTGPFTSWYPDGTVESHGHYLDFGSRSVPDGLWAFWYANGQRRTLGTYRRGEPQGCFATWDERGTRATGFVEGDQLRVAPCTPPAGDELAAIEGGEPATVEAPAWADISVQGMFGPGAIGASNAMQIDTAPSLQLAVNATARKHLGPFRFGPTAGMRLSGNTDYRALAAGGVFAIGLPALHSRLDADAGIELGAQYITGIAMRPMRRGVADVAFWSPLVAAQVAVAFKLSPYLAAVGALRADGAPARDVERDITYCDFSGCLPPQRETWQVGGLAYGLSVGLRLTIR